jgi:hypothetical protein
MEEHECTDGGICKTCIYVCDRSDEKPSLSAWCGNDESDKYALNVKDTDTCKEHRRDG